MHRPFIDHHREASEGKNSENLPVIRDKAITEKYAVNWQADAAHWEKYERKE